LQGFAICFFGKRSPHFSPAHFPVFHRPLTQVGNSWPLVNLVCNRCRSVKRSNFFPFDALLNGFLFRSHESIGQEIFYLVGKPWLVPRSRHQLHKNLFSPLSTKNSVRSSVWAEENSGLKKLRTFLPPRQRILGVLGNISPSIFSNCITIFVYDDQRRYAANFVFLA